MNEELNRYVTITLEILLFAALLMIISLFGGVSRDSINTKQEQKVIQNEIQKYRELSTYISKGKVVDGNLVDNLVTGDDVIRFIGNFRHDFPIDINLTSKTIKLEKYHYRPDGTSNWDLEYIIEQMDNHRISNFKVVPEIDEYSDEVIKVSFIRQ